MLNTLHITAHLTFLPSSIYPPISLVLCSQLSVAWASSTFWGVWMAAALFFDPFMFILSDRWEMRLLSGWEHASNHLNTGKYGPPSCPFSSCCKGLNSLTLHVLPFYIFSFLHSEYQYNNWSFEFPKLNLVTSSIWQNICFCSHSGLIKSSPYHFVRGGFNIWQIHMRFLSCIVPYPVYH